MVENNMKQEVNEAQVCSHRLARFAVLIIGVAIIFIVDYFVINTQIDSMHSIKHRAHNDIKSHISLVSDMIIDTNRYIYSGNIVKMDNFKLGIIDAIGKYSKLQILKTTVKDPNVAINNNLEHMLSSSFLQHKKIYVQALEVHLLGDYLSFAHLLKDIGDANNGQFFWGDTRYKVLDYPTADITMTFNVLTTTATGSDNEN